MTHPILTQFDDLDMAIGNTADLSMDRANALRTSLSAVKREAHALLSMSLVDDEQADADRGGYLPARRPLKTTGL